MLGSEEMFSGIAIAAGGAILAAFIAYVVKYLRKRLKQATGIVRIITRTDQQLPPHWQLMLQHVRDGKDEIDGKGELLNEEITFCRVSETEWRARTRYIKSLGFQFKCFVAVPRGADGAVRNWLDQQSIQEIDADETRVRHYWFLLPDVPRCQTADRPLPYQNNFYHPNVPEICYKAP